MKSIYKLIIDIGPLAVFFIFYTRSGLQDAIMPLMIATVIAVIISYLLEKKIPIMPTLGAGIVLIFGGLTIYFNDETFIKMKPTIINAVFAILLYGGIVLKKPLLKYLLGAALKLEEEGWKICPLICYDLRFPVFSRNNVDYDLLIYLANWPIKRIEAWDTLLKARSIENQCYTIGVNRVGLDGNDVPFNGHTKVFDAFGKELISAIENTEEVLQIEISLDDLKLKRRQMNFLQDRDNFTLL